MSNDMIADNSDMVDNILNELNNQGDNNQGDNNQNNQLGQNTPDPLQHSGSNQMHPPQMTQHNPNMEQQLRMPPPNMTPPPSMNRIPLNIPEQGFNNDIKNQVNYDNVKLNIKEKKVSVNSGLRNILSMLKNPLLITAIIYLLFNPFSKTLLAKYLPKLFSVNSSLIRRHISVIILSLVVAIIYVIITMFL